MVPVRVPRCVEFLWFHQVVGSDTRTLQFRYNISTRAKTNAFKPKQLEDDAVQSARYSQLGGCFSNYHQLLASSNVGVVWEAGIGDTYCDIDMFERTYLRRLKFAGEDLFCCASGDYSGEAKVLAVVWNNSEGPNGGALGLDLWLHMAT